MKMRTTAAAVGLAAILAAGAAAQHASRSIPLPQEIAFPEGIEYDSAAGVIYTAGAADGTLVRLDAKSGNAVIIAKPGVLLPVGNQVFPGVLGMKLDGANRLWVAGGRTGKVFVFDTKNSRLVKTITVPGEGSLLNDAVILPDGVIVTDTLRPTLWRIPVKGSDIGEAEAFIDLKGSPIAYTDGSNLNGIAKTPDNATLIVVQMNKGLLFKIDVATKAITPIDVGGEALTAGDGLVLDGRTLYVVRQAEQEIATVALAAGLASGKVVSRVKDPALRWPATAAKVGNELVVVNGQFNKRETKDAVRPFTLAAVPLARLGGK